jgi:hypothetical protein
MAQTLNVLPQLTRRPWQHCARGWLDSARGYCSVSGQDSAGDLQAFRGQAACVYSLIRPLRTGFRRICCASTSVVTVARGGARSTSGTRWAMRWRRYWCDATRFEAVPWKAWLEGHEFDLEILRGLFRAGDPLVAQDSSYGYYFESSALQDSHGQLDHSAAEPLVKRINGVARAADPGFRPVHLIGRYTAPDGTTSVVAIAGTAEARSKATAAATVLSSGVLIPEPPPKGPRYVRLAEQDVDVADVLRVLGQPDPLDWYDIYKAWEIVEHAVGGWRQVVAQGWVTRADIDRLTASANHPGISGDEARHARMTGTPGPDRTMTMREADALVRRLVANWIESNPSY